MRRSMLLAAALLAVSSPTLSRANDGANIVRGIIGFAASEIERQQRRKQQERANRRIHQQLVAAWQACHRGDLAACNQALSFRHLNQTDRARLQAKRHELLNARYQAAARARQLVEETRRRHHEQAERRLAEQRAEAERLQRLREQEEQRLAALRAFSEQRSACERYDLAACEQALKSPLASSQDASVMRSWQHEAQTYRQSRTDCQAGTASACTAALASPAIVDADRLLLQRWQADAQPFNRAMASITGGGGGLGGLPTSTLLTGMLAVLLSLALIAALFRRRATAHAGGPVDAQHADDEPNSVSFIDTLRQRLSEMKNTCQEALFAKNCPLDTEPSEQAPAAASEPEELPPPLPRDTPGAIAALELAEAYIEEVREANRPAFDDTATRRAQLSTLALAAKQLELAEKLDPDAELVVSDSEGDIVFTIGALKAKALILEARSYDDHNANRALPPLRQAIAVDPTNATAHYLLGMIEAANMNRARAVEAFETALALEPDNLTFRKELNRAQSISGAEATAFKATRLAERTYDAGVASWNVVAVIWNTFAVCWNILTFPIRMISALMRVFRIGL